MRGKILNKIDGIIKSRCAINHAPRAETIIITPHVGGEWKGFHLFWGLAAWSATLPIFYTGAPERLCLPPRVTNLDESDNAICLAHYVFG
jgi:hypothetical protein